MSKSDVEKAMQRKAIIFGLFSDVTRLRILKFLLLKKSANVSDIAKEINMSISCTSHHLQLLKSHQIVEAQRQGIHIFYKVVDDPFIKKLQSLINKF